MKLGQDLAAIGELVQQYHERTGTSVEMAINAADGRVSGRCYLPIGNGLTVAFRDLPSLLLWLTDLNNDIDPVASAAARQRAEALVEQKIRLEAEQAALSREIGELPDTQRIRDAQAAAQTTLQAAADRLALLEKARAVLAEEAEAKVKEADTAVSDATVEELEKMVEIESRGG